MSEILDITTAVDSDDCYCDGVSVVSLANTLRLGDISGVSYATGVRWLNLTIPKGSTITSAYVTFGAAEDQSGTTVNMSILAEAADSPITFSTFADYVARSKTSTPIAWNNLSAWVDGNDYQSPDVSALIQETIDREGWESGNALVLFFSNNASSLNARRRAETSGNPTYVALWPRLHIEYELPSPSPSPSPSPVNHKRFFILYMISQYFQRRSNQP